MTPRPLESDALAFRLDSWALTLWCWFNGKLKGQPRVWGGGPDFHTYPILFFAIDASLCLAQSHVESLTVLRDALSLKDDESLKQ